MQDILFFLSVVTFFLGVALSGTTIAVVFLFREFLSNPKDLVMVFIGVAFGVFLTINGFEYFTKELEIGEFNIVNIHSYNVCVSVYTERFLLEIKYPHNKKVNKRKAYAEYKSIKTICKTLIKTGGVKIYVRKN